VAAATTAGPGYPKFINRGLCEKLPAIPARRARGLLTWSALFPVGGSYPGNGKEVEGRHAASHDVMQPLTWEGPAECPTTVFNVFVGWGWSQIGEIACFGQGIRIPNLWGTHVRDRG
jgi:hypothetical protein